MKKLVLTIILCAFTIVGLAQLPINNSTSINKKESRPVLSKYNKKLQANRFLEQPKQRLDSFVLKAYDSLKFEWITYVKEHYKFNENENLSEYTYYEYSDENKQLKPYFNFILSYDTQDRLVLTEGKEWDSESNDWIPDEKIECTYDTDGTCTETEFYWEEVGNKWVDYWKTVVTFNEDGSEDVALESRWDENLNEWDILGKKANTYNTKGQHIFQRSYHSDDNGSTWILDWFFEFKYNFNGDISEWLHVDVEGDVWFSDWKEEYIYNDDGSLKFIIGWVWSETTLEWIYEKKYEYFYDNVGNVSSYIYSECDLETQVWNYSEKYDLSYNNSYSYNSLLIPYFIDGDDFDQEMMFNHMLDSINCFMFDNEDWQLNYKYKLFYSKHILNITEHQTENLTVYPNPASNIITINSPYDLNISGFIIYNLLGEQVKSFTIVNNKQISIENLKSGLYLYSIEHNQQLLSGKLVVK